MIKKIAAFGIVLIIGLLFVHWVGAVEIVLTTPISEQQLTKVRVSDVSDHLELKQLSFRLSIGYTNANGDWVEKRDFHEQVKNLPAVADNPDTPQDEKQPASPRYNQLKALIRTSGKPVEQIILEWVLMRYPGTIQ